MRRQNNNNKQNRRGGNKRNSPANPPPIRSNVLVDHVYRFRSTDGAATVITPADLVGIAGAMCTVANTTLTYIASSVSVKRVSIWTPPASQGAQATCSIEWAAPAPQAGARMIEVSDTTVSVARPAHVSAKPPKGSLLSLWVSPASLDTAMIITAPTGSVIDVHAVHVLDDASGIQTTVAVAAGTLGDLYWLPLDGVSDVYLPVSLQTTT